jgi:hypothetical protein
MDGCYRAERLVKVGAAMHPSAAAVTDDMHADINTFQPARRRGDIAILGIEATS